MKSYQGDKTRIKQKRLSSISTVDRAPQKSLQIAGFCANFIYMRGQNFKFVCFVAFVMLVAGFATPSQAQSAEGSGGDSSPAMDQAAVPDFPQNPGDEPTAAPVVVWCAVPDYGAQKIFVTPLRTAAPGVLSRLRMLSLRFVRAVNAQQQADLDVNQKVCAGSATTRAASAAQTRLMAPLLAQGFVPVVIGVF